MFNYDNYTLISDYDEGNDNLELEYINKLRDVSPTIDEYFTSHTYIAEYGPDDFTLVDLVNKAFAIALDELRMMGIYIDSSTYMGDYMYMSKIYEFRRVFDPLTLRIRLLNDTELYKAISEYLEITVIDDGGYEDVLYDVLYMFSTHHVSMKEMYRDLQRYCYDNLVCQPQFLTYITSTVEDVKYAVEANVLGDLTTTTDYIKNIYNGRVWFRTAMDYLTMKFNIPVSTELIQVIDEYDLDKVRPDVVKYYAYLDDDDKSIDDFPEYMHELYTDLIIEKHHKHSKHHYEYWEHRKIKVSDPGTVAALVAHHYTPTTTVDKMLEEAEELKVVLDESMIELSIAMVHQLKHLLKE